MFIKNCSLLETVLTKNLIPADWVKIETLSEKWSVAYSWVFTSLTRLKNRPFIGAKNKRKSVQRPYIQAWSKSVWSLLFVGCKLVVRKMPKWFMLKRVRIVSKTNAVIGWMLIEWFGHVSKNFQFFWVFSRFWSHCWR